MAACGAWLPAGWRLAGVKAGTSLRFGLGCSRPPFATLNLGAACGDDPTAVAANRDALSVALQLPSAPFWLRQVHGTDPVRLAAGERAGGAQGLPQADAAVTSLPGQVLAILTADCLPLLLAADDASEVGAAHAGWRGLAAGVIGRTLAAMQTPPERLCAWLGPAAGAAAYEVDEPVRRAFLELDAEAELGFAPARPGHYWLDLYAIARLQLKRAGVTRIVGGNHCTISEPDRFFSHRRDGRCGRMVSLIWIEPEPSL